MYTAEYSISQDNFHVQELRGLLDYNIENAITKFADDWHIIGLFNTVTEANDFIEKIKPKIQKDELVSRKA